MRKFVTVIPAAAVLPAFAPMAQAQNLDDIFRKVNPSVLVIRAKGRDVSAGGTNGSYSNKRSRSGFLPQKTYAVTTYRA